MKFLCLQISEKNVVGPATLGISLLVGSVTIIRPSDPFFCTQSVAICFWVQVYKENVASPRCRAGKNVWNFILQILGKQELLSHTLRTFCISSWYLVYNLAFLVWPMSLHGYGLEIKANILVKQNANRWHEGLICKCPEAWELMEYYNNTTQACDFIFCTE